MNKGGEYGKILSRALSVGCPGETKSRTCGGKEGWRREWDIQVIVKEG